MTWDAKSESTIMLKSMYNNSNKLYNEYKNKYNILESETINKYTNEYSQKVRYYKENIKRNKTNYWNAKLELIIRNKIT